MLYLLTKQCLNCSFYAWEQSELLMLVLYKTTIFCERTGISTELWLAVRIKYTLFFMFHKKNEYKEHIIMIIWALRTIWNILNNLKPFRTVQKFIDHFGQWDHLRPFATILDHFESFQNSWEHYSLSTIHFLSFILHYHLPIYHIFAFYF